MKIKTNKNTFILPDKGLHLLAADQYSDELIECLTTFINQRKKTKCIIYDSEGDMIEPKTAGFVYIPSAETIESWFGFKPKTLLNSELVKMIEFNSEMFGSLDAFRADLKDFITDSGMYSFKRILQQDTS